MVRLKVAFELLVNSGRDNSRKKDEGLARRDRSVCEMKDTLYQVAVLSFMGKNSWFVTTKRVLNESDYLVTSGNFLKDCEVHPKIRFLLLFRDSF